MAAARWRAITPVAICWSAMQMCMQLTNDCGSSVAQVWGRMEHRIAIHGTGPKGGKRTAGMEKSRRGRGHANVHGPAALKKRARHF